LKQKTQILAKPCRDILATEYHVVKSSKSVDLALGVMQLTKANNTEFYGVQKNSALHCTEMVQETIK